MPRRFRLPLLVLVTGLLGVGLYSRFVRPWADPAAPIRLWECAARPGSRYPPPGIFPVSDVDGDGLDDFVHGDDVRRGRDGAPLFRLGLEEGDEVVFFARRAEDVDGDGQRDVALGLRRADSTAVEWRVVSGRGGRIGGEGAGEDPTGLLGSFGARDLRGLDLAGDLDGDGTSEVLVLLDGHSSSTGSYLRALSVPSMDLHWELFLPWRASKVLFAAGDLSGDGVPDLWIASAESTLEARSGADGSLLWAFEDRDWSVLEPDVDRNGDGARELHLAQEGWIRSVDGRTGKELSRQSWDHARPCIALGDVDGDGQLDFCEKGGRWARLPLRLERSFVDSLRVLSGADGHLIAEQVFAVDRFWLSLPVPIGDLDGDGLKELLEDHKGRLRALSPGRLGR